MHLNRFSVKHAQCEAWKVHWVVVTFARSQGFTKHPFIAERHFYSDQIWPIGELDWAWVRGDTSEASLHHSLVTRTLKRQLLNSHRCVTSWSRLNFYELSYSMPIPDFRMPDIRKSMSPNKEFDKSELRERLTPTQYQVTQEHHTERSVSRARGHLSRKS